jgi:hypothetical protein
MHRKEHKRALQLHDALKIVIEKLDALDKAHQQGAVHRGLTPSTAA